MNFARKLTDESRFNNSQAPLCVCVCVYDSFHFKLILILKVK